MGFVYVKAVPAPIAGTRFGLVDSDVAEAIPMIATVCPLAVIRSPTCSSLVNIVPLPVTVAPDELIVPVPVRAALPGMV